MENIKLIIDLGATKSKYNDGDHNLQLSTRKKQMTLTDKLENENVSFNSKQATRLDTDPSSQVDYSNSSVSIVIPVYNEANSLPDLLDELTSILDKLKRPWEILVINDGSTDATLEVLKGRPVRTISHPYNIGNGGAIKTGIRHAVGEIIVTMDGDSQHDPKDIPLLLSPIGPFDMVVGARRNSFYQGIHRAIANKFYNFVASYVSDFKIRDLTSGFRAIKAEILRRYLYLLPNTFSYPTTLTLALIRSGHSLKYQPVRALKRTGKSKIRLLPDGIRFLLIIFKISTLFSPLKVFLPFSWIFFVLGLVNYSYTYYVNQEFTSMSLFMFIGGFLFFLLGLISEQISQLRFDRAEDPHSPS